MTPIAIVAVSVAAVAISIAPTVAIAVAATVSAMAAVAHFATMMAFAIVVAITVMSKATLCLQRVPLADDSSIHLHFMNRAPVDEWIAREVAAMSFVNDADKFAFVTVFATLTVLARLARLIGRCTA